MIVLVDDDPQIQASASQVLTSGGWTVEVFGNGAEALARLAQVEPELVVSDILMPGLTGLQLREQYGQRFPLRRTPFIFLSSLADPEQIVQALDTGADDYVVKPFQPAVLLARVRARLRRSTQGLVTAFEGDLSRLGFVDLMRFCEAKGLTGEIEVRAPGLEVRVPFCAGTIDPALADRPDDALGRLLALREGTFFVRSRPVDFAELAPAAVAGEAAAAPREKPAGRLSGVQAGRKLFQIQTEFYVTPAPQIVTLVMFEGRSVHKRLSAAPSGADRPTLERLIGEQHADVEREVQERLRTLADRGEKRPEADPKARFEDHFDAGLERFLVSDWAGAVAAWEAAAQLDPGHKVLAVNLAVARKKAAEKAG